MVDRRRPAAWRAIQCRFRATAISRLLCRSNAISEGVSIRGARKIPSFRLSKAVETVTELGFPPGLDGSMFLSQFNELVFAEGKFRGIGFAGQHGRRQHPAATGQDMAAQVRQGTALPDKIIHQQIGRAGSDLTVEGGLSRQPGKAIRAGMPTTLICTMLDSVGQSSRSARASANASGMAFTPSDS